MQIASSPSNNYGSSPTNSPVFSADSYMPSAHPTQLYFNRRNIKILLMENIHQNAVEALKKEEFNVEHLTVALNGQELIDKLQDVHVIGVRSKTKLTAEVLKAAPKLRAIGCFCIGTNQVDLGVAEEKGIPVFNSPFCNSRSVAELVIAQIISLSRKLGDKNKELHNGIWNKSAVGCCEIRGKTLGIIGYGHIGSQLSVLAEAMGMKVIFYDIDNVMPLGNAVSKSLDEVLSQSFFVTLHVPETPETKNMIGKKEIAKMQKGAMLLNASRGTVVVIDDLVEALKSGHLGGAYIDVYPSEPKVRKDPNWVTPLAGCPNTILTPHIGGSTSEAQASIGHEVAAKLSDYLLCGKTASSVNFPGVDVPYNPKTHRICNVHKNTPGVLREINNILGGFNISSQVLRTTEKIGYLVADVDTAASKQIKQQISDMDSSLHTRILY